MIASFTVFTIVEDNFKLGAITIKRAKKGVKF